MKDKPYFPSNGTEGDLFINENCAWCLKEGFYRNPKNKTRCKILTDSFDGKKPKHWVYKDGKPTCTSFRRFNDRKRYPKKDKSGTYNFIF